MNSTSRELISALTDFYNLIIKLPYINPTALVHPPEGEDGQGWPDINAEELRKRGRTEEVITLLRNLPYLRRPDSGKSKEGWMIGPDTREIAYCDGEVYDAELDKIQPTPGHCIWLANPANTEDGAALLLDVENGTITEYSVRSNRNVCLDADLYESLPLEDRWMAHSTLPVTDLFRAWTNKYKKLEWMPCLKEEGPGTVMWFISPKQDDAIFDDDDDYSEDCDESYEPSSEESDDDNYDSEDYEDESDPYEYDSEYESGDPVDQDTLEKKVQELNIDEDEFATVGNTRGKLEQEIRLGDGKLLATDKLALMKVVNEAYLIYIENGWPDAFNHDECQRQLSELSKQIEP